MTGNVGAAIRKSRLALNWSQQKLADKAGVTKAWIQRVERGKIKGPGTNRLRAVCGILGLDFDKIVSAEYLTKGEFEKEKALQIGTNVLQSFGIPITLYTSSDCEEPIGLIFVPELEGLSMLAELNPEMLQVENNDCRPYANAGESVILARDAKPLEGEQVAFKGKDNRCHIGIYHKSKDGDVIILPFGLGNIPFEGYYRGTVAVKWEWVTKRFTKEDSGD